VHNHPSGDVAPSPADIAVTRRLVAAGRLFDVPLIDRVVVGEGCRFSTDQASGARALSGMMQTLQGVDVTAAEQTAVAAVFIQMSMDRGAKPVYSIAIPHGRFPSPKEALLMKTIIGGSRGIADPAALETAIIDSGFTITAILACASRGVDELVMEWAKQHAIPVTIFPADWRKYGGRADLIRNEKMIAQAEACIQVWDGFSRGTAHMIEMAKLMHVKLHVHRWIPTGVVRVSTSPGHIRAIKPRR
jgi:hypothetical protein